MALSFYTDTIYFVISVYILLETETNVYLAGAAIPKVKTAKHLGSLLVTKGANDTEFTECRITEGMFVVQFMWK